MAGFNRAIKDAVNGLWTTIGFPAELVRRLGKKVLPYSAEASLESTRQAMHRVHVANKRFLKLSSDEKRRYIRRNLNNALEYIESLRFEQRTQEQHYYFNNLLLEFSNARTKRDKIYSTMHPLWFIRQLQYALFDPDAPLYRVYQAHLAGLAVEPPAKCHDQLYQLFNVDLPRFRRIEVNGLLLKDEQKIVDPFLLELKAFLDNEFCPALIKAALFKVKLLDGKLTWLPDAGDEAISKNAAAIAQSLLKAIRAKARLQIWQDAVDYIERSGNLEYAIKLMLIKGFAHSSQGMRIDDAFMDSLSEKIQTEFLAYPIKNEIHATVMRAQARGLKSVTEPKIISTIGMLNQTPLNHFIETACANQFAMHNQDEHGEVYNSVFTRACKVTGQDGCSLNDDGMDFVVNSGVFDLKYATPLFGQQNVVRAEHEDVAWHNGTAHVDLQHETIVDFNQLTEAVMPVEELVELDDGKKVKQQVEVQYLDMLPGGFKQRIHMSTRRSNIKVGIHHSLRDHVTSLQDIDTHAAVHAYEYMGPHTTKAVRFDREPAEGMTFRQKAFALLHTILDMAVGLLHRVLSFIADCIVKKNVLSTEPAYDGVEMETIHDSEEESDSLRSDSISWPPIPSSTSICYFGGSCGSLIIEIPSSEAPKAPVTPMQNKLRDESTSSFKMLCTSDEGDPPHLIKSWSPDQESSHGIALD